jgi:hypothetical protein
MVRAGVERPPRKGGIKPPVSGLGCIYRPFLFPTGASAAKQALFISPLASRPSEESYQRLFPRRISIPVFNLTSPREISLTSPSETI